MSPTMPGEKLRELEHQLVLGIVGHKWFTFERIKRELRRVFQRKKDESDSSEMAD